MPTHIALLALLAAVVAGCKNVDCGEGTTERDGLCVPSNETIGTAQCGPFTVLQGDRCVPMFPPTQCDPETTEPDVDGRGVTTCIGTGAGGCSARIACPQPAMGRQTICGQIYDFENNQPFAEPDAMGDPCTPGATSGPCSLGIRAYDGVAFATNPMTAPLTTGPVYIDDCGRYRVPDILPPGAGPAIALALDDAMTGPAGTTIPVGVATAIAPNTATRDVETFVVRMSTVGGWVGGPALSAGIYAPVYRARSTGTEPAVGVTFAYALMSNQTNFMTDTGRDHYFTAGSTNRTTLDGAANATTTNGTALVSGATLAEVYAGQGGLPAQCRFEPHAAAAIPFAIFVQVFRPISVPGMTCPQ
jgi:hypothetical protein